jgi:hypothetical protein
MQSLTQLPKPHSASFAQKTKKICGYHKMKKVNKDIIWTIALLVVLIIAIVFMTLYFLRQYESTLEAYQLHFSQRGHNNLGLYEGAGSVLLRLSEAGKDKAGRTMLVESRLMPYSDTSGLALDVSTPHSSTSQRYDQYQAPAASVIQVMIENLTGTPGEMKGKRFTDSSRGFSGRTPRTASGTLSALVHGVPYLETSRSKIQAATPTEFTGDKPTSIPLLSGVTLNRGYITHFHLTSLENWIAALLDDYSHLSDTAAIEEVERMKAQIIDSAKMTTLVYDLQEICGFTPNIANIYTFGKHVASGTRIKHREGIKLLRGGSISGKSFLTTAQRQECVLGTNWTLQRAERPTALADGRQVHHATTQKPNTGNYKCGGEGTGKHYCPKDLFFHFTCLLDLNGMHFRNSDSTDPSTRIVPAAQSLWGVTVANQKLAMTYINPVRQIPFHGEAYRNFQTMAMKKQKIAPTFADGDLDDSNILKKYGKNFYLADASIFVDSIGKALKKGLKTAKKVGQTAVNAFQAVSNVAGQAVTGLVGNAACHPCKMTINGSIEAGLTAVEEMTEADRESLTDVAGTVCDHAKSIATDMMEDGEGGVEDIIYNMLKDAALTAMTNKCKKVIKKKEAKIKSAIGMDDMSVNDIKAELTSEVCKDFCRDGKTEPLTLADSASLYD